MCLTNNNYYNTFDFSTDLLNIFIGLLIEIAKKLLEKRWIDVQAFYKYVTFQLIELDHWLKMVTNFY